MRNCRRRSTLELREARSDLNIGPRKISKGALHAVLSRRFRIRQWSGPAGAPKAPLGWVWG
eukprot:7497415-Alexandrium_andersonii.AAC.1